MVCMGEFGRAPRVALERELRRRDAGPQALGDGATRSCWPAAGVARGARGRRLRPHRRPTRAPTPVGPGDLAATMFAALGVDPAGHYPDPTGRPYPIATGRPISELYS